MLIRFSVQNSFSFKDRVVFSMLPGKGTLKKEHKSMPVNGVSVLKTGIIFGANASGKSNLIKAIALGQRLIIRGTEADRPIEYVPFKLDVNSRKDDTRLEYEIQSNGKNYAYGFIFNSKRIEEEWLYEITKANEKKIFERNAKSKKIFDIEPLLKLNKRPKEKQFLTFMAEATPNNQLFLHEFTARKTKGNVSDIADLENVVDWFINSLRVVFPDDKYKEGIKSEITNNQKLQHIYKELLSYFDTGVNGICLKDVDLEKLNIPQEVLRQIKNNLLNFKSDSIRTVLSTPDNTYFISRDKDDLKAQKFMTKHPINGSDSSELFDTANESDGTNRIIDYIPLIIGLLKGNNVFIIDEMERSLHPNLIYDLIDLFLSHCDNVNSQLIVATHESSLLTQKLLRKDEIWFAVKDDKGESKLHSLEDYNVRFDKEIRKDYLLGRFKGIPRLGNRYDLKELFNK